MRLFWKSVLLLWVATSVTSVSAQNYPMPSAVPDPPAICTGCPDLNSVGEVNDGKPTFPYDTLISLHTGRFVDSSSTITVQDVGMRTVRSGLVRVAPVTRNRIYLALGAATGAYTLDTFFSNKLLQGLVGVNTLSTGKPFSGRNPFEKLAKPDRFFYPEAPSSGWTTVQGDFGTVLTDFDADDRGNLYVATSVFGWGIVSDPGDATGTMLQSSVQVTVDNTANVLMSLRNGSSYHVYHSNASSTATLYDVTTAATPVFTAMRSGSTKAFSAWSKFEAGSRLALLNLDGHVRVYNFADLIADAAPLVDLTPTAGKLFIDLSFDDDGNLWLAESTNSASFNLLWKATPSGGTYTTSTFDVYGPTAFSPRKIHASGGYIAVAGLGTAASNDFDLRLLKVVSGTPQLQDTNGFIGKYYHRAPSGFAQPSFSTLQNVRIVTHAGKTYLFYSAWGLGDVYELSDAPRITSMTPLSGTPLGGTSVDIFGSGFTADATVTFGGLTASSSFLNAAHMTAVSPVHASGAVNVVVSPPGETPMTAPRQFTYILDTPQQFVATATSTTSVSTSWNGVAGAVSYEVSRMDTPGNWTVIGTPAGTALIDGGRTAETTYVYRVRANDGSGNFSAHSTVDLATTMTSASSNIVAGTPILAADFTSLRTRVNGVRTAAGLFTFSFSGTISGPILAQHMDELRTALTAGRTSLGLTTPAFTDPSSVAGVKVKALHLNELLDLMR